LDRDATFWSFYIVFILILQSYRNLFYVALDFVKLGK